MTFVNVFTLSYSFQYFLLYIYHPHKTLLNHFLYSPFITYSISPCLEWLHSERVGLTNNRTEFKLVKFKAFNNLPKYYPTHVIYTNIIQLFFCKEFCSLTISCLYSVYSDHLHPILIYLLPNFVNNTSVEVPFLHSWLFVLFYDPPCITRTISLFKSVCVSASTYFLCFFFDSFFSISLILLLFACFYFMLLYCYYYNLT